MRSTIDQFWFKLEVREWFENQITQPNSEYQLPLIEYEKHALSEKSSILKNQALPV